MPMAGKKLPSKLSGRCSTIPGETAESIATKRATPRWFVSFGDDIIVARRDAMLSMLIFAAAAAGPSPAEVAQAIESVQPSFHCEGIGDVQTVDNKAKMPVRAEKLNELPNANVYKAVVRVDEHGCRKPLIVAYDIGSAPKKQR
jgi:hypothetical protein